MQIVYTPSAEKELAKFHLEQTQELEAVIRKNKYVFGDDTIEVTGSDIRDAARTFTSPSADRESLPITRFLLRTYATIGVLMVTGGLFYPNLKSILRGDPVQRGLLLGGLSLLLLTVFFGYYLQFRAQNYYRRLGRRHELELSHSGLEEDVE